MRVAITNDIDALVALDSVAAHDSTRAFAIEKWVGDGLCHIASLNGEAAGYGVLTHNFFGHDFITMLMVAPASRRMGVARHLLRHLGSLCEAEKLWSSTNQSNATMQKLFEVEGFVHSGIIENLDEGDPELIYLKFLGVGKHP